MSDVARLIGEAAARLFAEHLDEAAVRIGAGGGWLGEAWNAIEAMGLPLALLDEAQGGFGIAPREALGLIRLAGEYAAPLPIGETMVANLALARAGLPLAEGPAALAMCGPIEGGRLVATLPRIAWGARAGTLVVQAGDRLVRVSGDRAAVDAGRNLAGHPRDTLRVDMAVSATAPFAGELIAMGAAVRALQIAGGLERVLALTIDHVSTRAQFAQPLARFQAVQHEVAQLAGEVAAAGAAADLAGEALFREDGALAIAAARVRGGEAVGAGVGYAHQLHGAIGFTAEHRLHLHTTALWAWRDEFGGEALWAGRLGEAALAAGPGGFWPLVTAA